MSLNNIQFSAFLSLLFSCLAFTVHGADATKTNTVAPTPARPEFRVMQADSWGRSILTPDQIEDLVDTCRRCNLNVIMPEVRKVGDAAYESSLEPRATNIEAGFDPLARLLQLAHDTSAGKKRIAVHGWFVIHRIGRGENLDPKHVLMRHPEYEMLKRDGSRNDRSRYLDPGHPGAVDHNISVLLDCLGRYDLDGINCDYIRYPEDDGDFGYNPISVQRFNAFYGKTGTPDPKDPDWAAWRRECVSLELKKLYVKAWKLKPHALITCDTVNWGNGYTNFLASRAYSQAMQDWAGWLRDCLLDYNALMNYTRTSDTARFQEWSKLSLREGTRRGSIIGIGAYLQSSVQSSMDLLLWLRNQGADGFFIYDWGSEVQGTRGAETREQFYQALREQVTPTWAELPEPKWKTAPTTAILEGTITHEGKPVDHAHVMLKGHPETQTVTDGSGWYAMLNLRPGACELQISSPKLKERTVSARILGPGEIVTINAELSKTGP